LTHSTPSAKIDVFSEGYGRNDLQPVVVERTPPVAAALAALRMATQAAGEASAELGMTGSGACAFAAFASAEAAERVLARLPAAQNGVVMRTVAVHPLKRFARDA
jgi:4-diphosphocytidyl-2-C-methyl-D-erythritol kinase